MFEVNRVAKEQDASLMVVGSHGSSLARETLLGGTAMGILHHAQLPVLVIRLKIVEQDDGPSRCESACADFRKHVLFCTDFSETAERAFTYVEKIVEFCRGDRHEEIVPLRCVGRLFPGRLCPPGKADLQVAISLPRAL